MSSRELPTAVVQVLGGMTRHWRDPDLLDVEIWGLAVTRRVDSITKRLVSPISLERGLTLAGDARLAAVALHEMLDGVWRYVAAHPDVSLPMPEPMFDGLRNRAIAARHSVAHWDDKLERGGKQE